MRKLDYRPYCFDSGTEPLKTRHQQLLEAVKHTDITADIDKDTLNAIIEQAIKNNPVNVNVNVDNSAIEGTLGDEFCKVHSHITRAENEIIETLSCNCNKECDCGEHASCSCNDNKITKQDLADAVSQINSHIDETIEMPDSDIIIETISNKIDNAVVTINNEISSVKDAVKMTETKVDEFRELYETFHD